MSRLKMVLCGLLLGHSWTFKGCNHWKCNVCGAWEVRP